MWCPRNSAKSKECKITPGKKGASSAGRTAVKLFYELPAADRARLMSEGELDPGSTFDKSSLTFELIEDPPPVLDDLLDRAASDAPALFAEHDVDNGVELSKLEGVKIGEDVVGYRIVFEVFFTTDQGRRWTPSYAPPKIGGLLIVVLDTCGEILRVDYVDMIEHHLNPIELPEEPKGFVVSDAIITVKEAEKVGKKSRQALAKLLRKVSQRSGKLAAAKAGKIDAELLDRLAEIRDELDALAAEFKETQTVSDDWAKQLKTTIRRLHRMGGEGPFKTALVEIESLAALAYSKGQWIVEADAIIEDPKKAGFDRNLSIQREINRLARRVKQFYPAFRGHTVKTEGTMQGVDVWLKGKRHPSADPNAPRPIEAIIPLLQDLMDWDLRKIGLGGKVKFPFIDEEPYSALVSCNIDF